MGYGLQQQYGINTPKGHYVKYRFGYHIAPTEEEAKQGEIGEIGIITGQRWVEDSKSSEGDNWATVTLGFITADLAVLEPTDEVWYKWAGYAVAGVVAGAYLYSGDYISKMNGELKELNVKWLVHKVLFMN